VTPGGPSSRRALGRTRKERDCRHREARGEARKWKLGEKPQMCRQRSSFSAVGEDDTKLLLVLGSGGGAPVVRHPRQVGAEAGFLAIITDLRTKTGQSSRCCGAAQRTTRPRLRASAPLLRPGEELAGGWAASNCPQGRKYGAIGHGIKSDAPIGSNERSRARRKSRHDPAAIPLNVVLCPVDGACRARPSIARGHSCATTSNNRYSSSRRFVKWPRGCVEGTRYRTRDQVAGFGEGAT